MARLIMTSEAAKRLWGRVLSNELHFSTVREETRDFSCFAKYNENYCKYAIVLLKKSYDNLITFLRKNVSTDVAGVDVKNGFVELRDGRKIEVVKS